MSKTDEQRLAEWEARIDIHWPVEHICQRLGIDPSYVAELVIRPDTVVVKQYLGKVGSYKGAKNIDLETGEAAMETLVFKVRA